MGNNKRSGKSSGKRSSEPDPLSSESASESTNESTNESTGEPCRVGRSPIHGRGVFATRAIAPDEQVHVAPMILLTDDEHEMLTGTSLEGYVYDWSDGGVGFALGLGSVFNHSRTPNLAYFPLDEDHPAAPGHVYTAVRDIEVGEELTIDYSGDGEVELWFNPDA